VSLSRSADLPPGFERLEALPRLAEDVAANWPEYLSILQEPSLYAAAGAVGAAGFGGLAGARRAARHLSGRPGDIVLGRRMDTRLDRFLKTPVVARWADRTHHVEVFGPTGSGKTSALLPQALQDLLCGHTVGAVEIYGDFATALIPYAIALGRPLFVFDPSLDGSLCWNLLAGDDDEGVVGHFSSVVEGLFVHHFYGPFNGDAARAFAGLAREYARHKGAEADMALFKLLLSDRAFLYRVLQVEVEGSGHDKTETVGAPWVGRETRSWFDSAYLRWSEKLRVDYMTELKVWTNKLLAKGAARRALCPGPRDLTLDLRAALSTPGALVVMRFPVEAVDEEPAHAMARFATKTIQDLTLRRLADARTFGLAVPPLALFLDELPTLVGREFRDAISVAEWMTLVRKQNVSVTVAHQGGALIGDVLSGALDTNARTTLIGPGLGGNDLLRAQKILGSEEREVHDERVTTTGLFGFGHDSRSRGTRTMRAARFDDDELRFSKVGHWVLMPFRDREQHPPERLRVRRVPPPAAFAEGSAGRSWRRMGAA
jgi:hypothetical protein